MVISLPMSSFTRPPFNPWLSLLFHCPYHLSHYQLMLQTIRPQVCITTILISVVVEDNFMEASIPTISKTTHKTSLIFMVFKGFIIVTEGRTISNKTKWIMALHNGPITVLLRIMSGANFAYPSAIHLFNVLSFTTMDNIWMPICAH